MKKPKLFLVCTGLGIVHRGFETYIADLADKLLTVHKPFSASVYSGGFYQSDIFKARKIFCVPRNSIWCNKLFGAAATSEIEQISFFISFIWQILFNRPSAIYLGEYKLYCYLFKFRKLFKLKYSLILYTGGQVSPGLFDTNKDYVHHVTDVYYNDLVKIGYPPNRQFILPHFININNLDKTGTPRLKSYNTHGKKIVISVGLIDKPIKKMDQFVKVLANNPTKYFPVILGESTVDTPEIENMLIQYFGKGNYFLGKVNRDEIMEYLYEADLFMLLSPKESFGIASLEALSVGLPVICCDYHESRFVLKDFATLVNCSDEKNITNSLVKVFSEGVNDSSKKSRIEFVQKNYSWDELQIQYLNMFNTILKN